jgi:hypothetical protein
MSRSLSKKYDSDWAGILRKKFRESDSGLPVREFHSRGWRKDLPFIVAKLNARFFDSGGSRHRMRSQLLALGHLTAP